MTGASSPTASYFGEQDCAAARTPLGVFTAKAAKPSPRWFSLPKQAFQGGGGQFPARDRALGPAVAVAAVAAAGTSTARREVARFRAAGGTRARPGTGPGHLRRLRDLTRRETELSRCAARVRVPNPGRRLYTTRAEWNQIRSSSCGSTIEALPRGGQEDEAVNKPRTSACCTNPAPGQHVPPPRRLGPTPDDMDGLLATVWKEPSFFLGPPQGRRRLRPRVAASGIYRGSVGLGGQPAPGVWRGRAAFSMSKIPVADATPARSCSATRRGLCQGVIGLRQDGIPDELTRPGLNVRLPEHPANKGDQLRLGPRLLLRADPRPERGSAWLENVELGQRPE